jgi:hypothetical protein
MVEVVAARDEKGCRRHDAKEGAEAGTGPADPRKWRGTTHEPEAITRSGIAKSRVVAYAQLWMIGRLTAVALTLSIFAGAGMVGASACGGDAFTTAPDDASLRDSPSEAETTGEGGRAADSNEAAADDDGGADALLDALGADASDGQPSDVLTLPDVLEAAPAHCTNGSFECIPPIPTGWEGPFEIYRGTSPPTGCSTNFVPSYAGSVGLDAGPATCGCSCATATGVQCSPVTANLFVGSLVTLTCTTLSHCTSVSLSPGQCAGNVNAPSQCPSLIGNGLFTLSGSSADGGSCAPTATTALPLLEWASLVRACVSDVTLAQVDCPSGSVCAPKPMQPYEDTALCVAQVGDVACPGSDYTNRYVAYGASKDLRRCTDCTCGPVTGSSCTGFVDVTPSSSGASACTGTSSIRYNLPQGCAAVQQPGDFHASITAQPGTCTPNTPVPSGAAAPAIPTTFCCQ